jgi:hypothetical protein
MEEPRRAVFAEAAVRTWARDVLNLPVFYGTNVAAGFPQVVLRQVGGTDLTPLVQFDCWADTKQQAGTTAADLMTEVSRLASVDADGTRLHGGTVEQCRWLPDPNSDRPRYVVDVSFSVTASLPDDN